MATAKKYEEMSAEFTKINKEFLQAQNKGLKQDELDKLEFKLYKAEKELNEYYRELVTQKGKK